MVYFRINGLGYNCGYSKIKCPTKNQNCIECIKNRLKQMGFEFGENLVIFEVDSYEKQLKLEQEIIWQKFLDIINIKHIIIIDKESGLTLLNYPVSGVDVDPNLLSGFIQANITFSESEKVSRKDSSSLFEYQFYEFQYKNFNILLKDGNFIRLCLILDHKASDKMRNHMFQFLEAFERRYRDDLVEFKKSGIINFDITEVIEYIINTFDINLVFPMTLAHSIPPHELEEINSSVIQKAIYNLAKELLGSKPFFFINNMINRLKKIVKLEPNIVLYEIYQLLERRVITPTSIEAVAQNIETIQEASKARIAKTKSISSIIITNSDLSDLQKQIKSMDDITAKNMIKELNKKGKSAEKDLAYQIAHKEYNKALYIAREFNLKEDINKISQKIFDLDYKTKQIELDFTIEMAESAEKNEDLINSINYYQKAVEILEGFLVYNVFDSRLKKFKKKIMKLREEI
ncbi:MAG: hypothetical protein ACFE8J_09305 [Candidatus Heimdallarchaeota archaeon]